ncbi:uncharacterized protein BJ171DRAFT_488495 [Polychytrium aggregatum]|uniref:uncharacterized protein n=1 Tax=Polychytrium aggregatum TaxID=110093 RepID=UPI0022FE445E|nr:uncharacterized protein BJ171DRAFT_488495 [Polychytrium aggregatum]KAI9209098.1 hypothetical protein BJ171DRAFT_488495 [Polychytrium aggregatum]
MKELHYASPHSTFSSSSRYQSDPKSHHHAGSRESRGYIRSWFPDQDDDPYNKRSTNYMGPEQPEHPDHFSGYREPKSSASLSAPMPPAPYGSRKYPGPPPAPLSSADKKSSDAGYAGNPYLAPSSSSSSSLSSRPYYPYSGSGSRDGNDHFMEYGPRGSGSSSSHDRDASHRSYGYPGRYGYSASPPRAHHSNMSPPSTGHGHGEPGFPKQSPDESYRVDRGRRLSNPYSMRLSRDTDEQGYLDDSSLASDRGDMSGRSYREPEGRSFDRPMSGYPTSRYSSVSSQREHHTDYATSTSRGYYPRRPESGRSSPPHPSLSYSRATSKSFNEESGGISLSSQGPETRRPPTPPHLAASSGWGYPKSAALSASYPPKTRDGDPGSLDPHLHHSHETSHRYLANGGRAKPIHPESIGRSGSAGFMDYTPEKRQPYRTEPQRESYSKPMPSASPSPRLIGFDPKDEIENGVGHYHRDPAHSSRQRSVDPDHGDMQHDNRAKDVHGRWRRSAEPPSQPHARLSEPPSVVPAVSASRTDEPTRTEADSHSLPATPSSESLLDEDPKHMTETVVEEEVESGSVMLNGAAKHPSPFRPAPITSRSFSTSPVPINSDELNRSRSSSVDEFSVPVSDQPNGAESLDIDACAAGGSISTVYVHHKNATLSISRINSVSDPTAINILPILSQAEYAVGPDDAAVTHALLKDRDITGKPSVIDPALHKRIYHENQACMQRLQAATGLLLAQHYPLPEHMRLPNMDGGLQTKAGRQWVFEFHRLRTQNRYENSLRRIVHKRIQRTYQRRFALQSQYKDVHQAWTKKIEQLEESIKLKKQKRKNFPFSSSSAVTSFSSPSVSFGGAGSAGLGGGSDAFGGRANRRMNPNSDAILSEEAYQAYLASLKQSEEERLNQELRAAKDPPMMICDTYASSLVGIKYRNSNGLVQDPVRELVRFNQRCTQSWSEAEKRVFWEKLLVYGKTFHKIKEHLPKKTVHDCVIYFYRKKHDDALRFLGRPFKTGQQNMVVITDRTTRSVIRKGGAQGPPRQKPIRSAVESDFISDSSSALSRGSRPVEGSRKDERQQDEASNDSGSNAAKRPRGDDSKAGRVGRRNRIKEMVKEKEDAKAKRDAGGEDDSHPGDTASEAKEDAAAPPEVRKKSIPRLPEIETKAADVADDAALVEGKGLDDDSGSVEDEPAATLASPSGASTPTVTSTPPPPLPLRTGPVHIEEVARWTDEDKIRAQAAFEKYGRNFALVALAVGTKSEDQCRNYYNNTKRRLKQDASKDVASLLGGLVQAMGPSSKKKRKIIKPKDKEDEAAVPEAGGAGRPPTDEHALADTGVAQSVSRSESKESLHEHSHVSSDGEARAAGSRFEYVAVDAKLDVSAQHSRTSSMSHMDLDPAMEEAANVMAAMSAFGAKAPVLSTVEEEGPSQEDVADAGETEAKVGLRSSLSISSVLNFPETADDLPSGSSIAGDPKKARKGRVRKDKGPDAPPSTPTDAMLAGPSSGKPIDGSGAGTARKTVSYWAIAEKSEFKDALKKYGRNWDMIAKAIGSKSIIQIRNYYHNFRHKLDFDKILEENGFPVEDEKVMNGIDATPGVGVLADGEGPGTDDERAPGPYDTESGGRVLGRPPPGAAVRRSPRPDHTLLPPRTDIHMGYPGPSLHKDHGEGQGKFIDIESFSVGSSASSSPRVHGHRYPSHPQPNQPPWTTEPSQRPITPYPLPPSSQDPSGHSHMAHYGHRPAPMYPGPEYPGQYHAHYGPLQHPSASHPGYIRSPPPYGPASSIRYYTQPPPQPPTPTPPPPSGPASMPVGPRGTSSEAYPSYSDFLYGRTPPPAPPPPATTSATPSYSPHGIPPLGAPLAAFPGHQLPPLYPAGPFHGPPSVPPVTQSATGSPSMFHHHLSHQHGLPSSSRLKTPPVPISHAGPLPSNPASYMSHPPPPMTMSLPPLQPAPGDRELPISRPPPPEPVHAEVAARIPAPSEDPDRFKSHAAAGLPSGGLSEPRASAQAPVALSASGSASSNPEPSDHGADPSRGSASRMSVGLVIESTQPTSAPRQPDSMHNAEIASTHGSSKTRSPSAPPHHSPHASPQAIHQTHRAYSPYRPEPSQRRASSPMYAHQQYPQSKPGRSSSPTDPLPPSTSYPSNLAGVHSGGESSVRSASPFDPPYRSSGPARSEEAIYEFPLRPRKSASPPVSGEGNPTSNSSSSTVPAPKGWSAAEGGPLDPAEGPNPI